MPISYDTESKTFQLKDATDEETKVLIGIGIEFIAYHIAQNLVATKLNSGELSIEEVSDSREDNFAKMMKSFGKEIKH